MGALGVTVRASSIANAVINCGKCRFPTDCSLLRWRGSGYGVKDSVGVPLGPDMAGCKNEKREVVYLPRERGQ